MQFLSENAPVSQGVSPGYGEASKPKIKMFDWAKDLDFS
jgi:hypothetical protein